MPTTGQNFSLMEGDHKVIRFEVSGFNTADAEEIYWYCSGEIEKDISDMTVTDDEIKFDLNSEDTVGMNGRFKHELKIIDSVGNVSTLAVGKMTVGKPKRVLA